MGKARLALGFGAPRGKEFGGEERDMVLDLDFAGFDGCSVRFLGLAGSPGRSRSSSSGAGCSSFKPVISQSPISGRRRDGSVKGLWRGQFPRLVLGLDKWVVDESSLHQLCSTRRVIEGVREG